MLNDILTVLGLVVLSCILILWKVSKKFSNDYQLNLIVAPKGVGKTSLLTKISLKGQHDGRSVYSNVRVPGNFHMLAEDLGRYEMDKNSIMLSDESGIVYDNRKYKDFEDYTRDWYVYQRQYQVTAYLFSQANNVDLKLRDLCDFIWLGKKYFNVLSVFRKYKKKQIMIRATAQSDARIATDFVPVPVIAGGLVFVWLPRWAPYFKSFDPPKLAKKNFKLVPKPEKFISPRFGVKEHALYYTDVLRNKIKGLFSCRKNRGGLVRKLLAVFHKSTDK